MFEFQGQVLAREEESGYVSFSVPCEDFWESELRNKKKPDTRQTINAKASEHNNRNANENFTHPLEGFVCKPVVISDLQKL